MDDSRDTSGDQRSADLRQCPTRTDGAQVLFAHKVNNGQCQDRQRGLYHKCYTCAWNNNYVAKHGFPALAPKSSDLPATPALEVT